MVRRSEPAVVDELLLARRAASAGSPPSEVVSAYLRSYGVAPRRIRKHAKEVAIVGEVLAAERPRSVLDCPCGWGRLAFVLTGEGRATVFADRSAERLGLFRALGFGRLGPVLRADALSLPFPDRCFDLVLSAHLNYHFDRREDRLRHLRECLRVARRSALVSYHGALSPRRALRGLGSALRGRSPLRTMRSRDLRSEAAGAGFEVVAVHRLSRFSGHAYALLRRAST